MSVLKITKENFNRVVVESTVPVLIDFYADWCGPCRMVSPIVEEIAHEKPDVRVVKINVDEEPHLAQNFNVVSIPTLVTVKNGKVENQAVGYKDKKTILEMLKN